MILTELAQYKYFLPLDVFERHKFIASKLPQNSSVLDVGGSLSQLRKFLKNSEITTVDVKPPADIIYKGRNIPVPDSSFDAVTAIDVLEHLPKNRRAEFVVELYRLAKKTVILSAPLGTTAHIEYEKRLLAENHFSSYLEEHVKFGLPTPYEVKLMAKKFDAEVCFSGDIRLTEILARVHSFEVGNKYLNLAIFWGKLVFNLLANLIVYPLTINSKPSKFTNRYYLVILKSDKYIRQVGVMFRLISSAPKVVFHSFIFRI